MTTTILTDEQVVTLAYQIDAQPEITMMRQFARAVEQAVLQSDEIQALRKDAERLKYLLNKVCMYQAASYGCKFEILNLPVHWGDCERDAIPPFLAAIDAAMEVKPC